MPDKNNLFNKLTIVGGQPSRRALPHFNNNLERLLFKASSDEDLKQKLLNDRTSVIENPEFLLSPQDKIILKNISSSALEDMVNKFTHQRTSRRSFLKNAAATVALLATGSLMINCRSERRYNYDDYNGEFETTGIRPEEEEYGTGEIGQEEEYIPITQNHTIIPEGGTIYYDYPLELRIDIPENAVNKPENIVIDIVNIDTLPNIDEEICGHEAHYFSPEDLTLLKEITVHYLKYPKIQTVYRLNKDKWEEIPVEQEEKHSFIRIKKFGYYAAVIKPE